MEWIFEMQVYILFPNILVTDATEIFEKILKLILFDLE